MDHEVTATDSSPAAEVAVEPIVTGDTDASPASEAGVNEGSPAPQARTGLDVAREVLASLNATSQESHPDPDPVPTDKPDSPSQDADEVPFHKHPRWQEKLALERDLRAQLDAAKPAIETHQRVKTFQERTRVSDVELDDGLQILDWLKNDPERLLTALRPYYDALKRTTGEVLDQDLQDKFDKGQIDEETARELQQKRASAASLAASMDKRNRDDAARAEQQRTEAQRQRFQDFETATINAVVSWEKSWKDRDPDYDLKKRQVEARVALLTQKEPPTSPDAAVAIADKALKEVNDEMKHLANVRRQPTDTRRIPATNRTGGRGPVAQPKTSLDVVRNALMQTRAGAA